MDNFEFKKIKTANIIAVGGMIAAGKTTLAEEVAAKINAKVLYELDDNDDIQKSLLKGLYEKKPIAASVFQLYFFLRRFENYKIAANENKCTTIVDRTVFEDRLFAYHNMVDDPITFNFYSDLWKDKIHELLYSVGLPKLYIIIKIDWETFKDRLFLRNRKVETDNFEQNYEYFKKLNEIYVPFLEKICTTYGIDYMTVDAKDNLENKINQVVNQLNKIDKI